MPTAKEMIVLEGYFENRFNDSSKRYIDLSVSTSVSARRNDDGSISVYINDQLLERFFPIPQSDLANANGLYFALNLTGAWNALPEIHIDSFKSFS